MGIRHAAVKVEGDKGYSSEWNADHVMSGTQYWSATGFAFMSVTSGAAYDDDEQGIMDFGSAGDGCLCPVDLPHGAVITGVIVNGTIVGNWNLYRRDRTDTLNKSSMATAAGNTEDTTITNGTVDNQTYVYWIVAYTDATSVIKGARITYTL